MAKVLWPLEGILPVKAGGLDADAGVGKTPSRVKFFSFDILQL
jgi:hypothetical protein